MRASIDNTLSRIEYATDTLAIVAMFACMVLVCTDVFCRYVLIAPQTWVTDVLVLYLLPAVFFMGLPGSYAKGAHVAVDVICGYLRGRPRLILSLLARVVGIIIFFAIAYYGVGRVVDAVRLGEIQPGTLVNWPLWPSVLVVPIGCAIALARAAERFCVEFAALGGEEGEIVAVLERAAHTEEPAQ